MKSADNTFDKHRAPVTTLSRFARSISDMWKNVEKLDAKGVSFQILDMNLDTSTPTGKLMLTMLGAVVP
jgi:DNA invertase Pin-like site-specific DNA recombinase